MANAPLSENLRGLTVLTLESRRSEEFVGLLEKRGATVESAPSLREVPLTEQSQVFGFGEQLFLGQCEAMLLLTGVGTEMLVDGLALRHERSAIIERLSQVRLYCRGPKPVAALRKLGLSPRAVAPEPNTWRELVATLAMDAPWTGKRLYVQEYGIRNERLMAAIAELGAAPLPVPVYAWQLPLDTKPLEAAVSGLAEGRTDVIVFTSGHQIVHLFRIAEQLDQVEPLTRALLERVVIASVGPVTSEVLTDYGLAADLEPVHPKMGQLAFDLAERGPDLVKRKRESGVPSP